MPGSIRGVGTRLAAVATFACLAALVGGAPAGATSLGSWSPAPGMGTARAETPAVATLGDGRVLVAGGSSDGTNSGAINTAEVYDPLTGVWSAVANMPAARIGAGAAVLPNGRVLVVGGFNGASQTQSTAYVYDPASNSWSSVTSMGTARAWPSVSRLASGRVLVAGGGQSGGGVLATAEIYDPSAGTWTPTGSLAHGRDEAATATLGDGRVLVTGGYDGSSLSSTELFNPATGTWSGGPAGMVTEEGGAATLPDGRVLVADGSTDSASASQAEIYDPSSNAWTPAADTGLARYGVGAATMADGRVLLVGGDDDTNALDTAQFYTPPASPETPAAGAQGPQAPAGQNGPTTTSTPAAPVAAMRLVTCRSVTSHVRRHGQRVTVHRQHCTRSLVSGLATLNLRSIVRATLSRHGRVYATAAVRGSRLVLHSRRALRPGRYRIVFVVRRGHRTVRRTATITLR